VEQKYIDGELHREEVYKQIENDNKIFFNFYASQVHESRFVGKLDSLTKLGLRNKVPIAYVPIFGAIMTGESKQKSWQSDAQSGSDSVCRWIREIGQMKNIKCVILHVDSRGGAAIAGSAIHESIRRLRENDIKVVAIMSNVAASAGYMVCTPCDKIICSPLTVTGSIGVFVLKPVLDKFWDMFGMTFDRWSQNPENSTFASDIKHWTEKDFKRVEENVDECYDMFKKMVAEGRGMSLEEVENLAKGRVHTGEKAKNINLVDDFGGLEEAIGHAKELCEIKDDDFKILAFPKKTTILEQIMQRKTPRHSDDFNAYFEPAPFDFSFIRMFSNWIFELQRPQQIRAEMTAPTII